VTVTSPATSDAVSDTVTVHLIATSARGIGIVGMSSLVDGPPSGADATMERYESSIRNYR
jgi:hypothetical protein